MYQLKRIRDKDVYLVSAHHEALEAWAEIRRALDVAPDLISLDQHTDTLAPFQSYVTARQECDDEWNDDGAAAARQALVEQIDFRDNATVREAIMCLQHDEHVQAATRSGIIDLAFVFSIEGSQTRSEQEEQRIGTFRGGNKPPPPPSGPNRYRLPNDGIFVIPFDCHIGCNTSTHDASCYRALSDQVLETSLLERQIKIASEMSLSSRNVVLRTKPYVLDLDLDTFHTYRSLSPIDSVLFHKLISGAQAVTIAIEGQWTSDLWLEDSDAPIDDMLSSLYQHIEKAAARS